MYYNSVLTFFDSCNFSHLATSSYSLRYSGVLLANFLADLARSKHRKMGSLHSGCKVQFWNVYVNWRRFQFRETAKNFKICKKKFIFRCLKYLKKIQLIIIAQCSVGNFLDIGIGQLTSLEWVQNQHWAEFYGSEGLRSSHDHLLQ
jgi:hypothetical protein